MFSFGTHRPRRRPSLTPLIDVVFLLLVFFMLATRFGGESGLRMNMADGGLDWTGPPRLIDVDTRSVRLNGTTYPLEQLAQSVAPLMQSSQDPILVRALGETDVGRLVKVLDTLRAAGFTSLAVVE